MDMIERPIEEEREGKRVDRVEEEKEIHEYELKNNKISSTFELK
jgi:hypothetical protein